METNGIGFNPEKKLEYSLEDYKDEWVLITLRGNGSYAGKLCDIDNKEARLLPYQKVTYNDNGMMEYRLVNDGFPDSLQRRDIVKYRPSSEEETLNFCKYMNRKEHIQFLREKKEIFELENQSKQIDEFKDNLENRIIQPFKKSTN